jgi:hypothetical protein
MISEELVLCDISMSYIALPLKRCIYHWALCIANLNAKPDRAGENLQGEQLIKLFQMLITVKIGKYKEPWVYYLRYINAGFLCPKEYLRG